MSSQHNLEQALTQESNIINDIKFSQQEIRHWENAWRNAISQPQRNAAMANIRHEQGIIRQLERALQDLEPVLRPVRGAGARKGSIGVRRKKAHLIKGSKAAKDHMARLRAMRGKKVRIGGRFNSTQPASVYGLAENGDVDPNIYNQNLNKLANQRGASQFSAANFGKAIGTEIGNVIPSVVEGENPFVYVRGVVNDEKNAPNYTKSGATTGIKSLGRKIQGLL